MTRPIPRRIIRTLRRDTRAVAALEYGIIAAFHGFGAHLTALFGRIGGSL